MTNFLTSVCLQPGWRAVLLAPRAKFPQGNKWQIVVEERIVERHMAQGGNIGLVCGESSGVAVLDFDDATAYREMSESISPLCPWVITGSGKYHCYVQWEAGLPAKIEWRGTRVGEVQRGPGKQHVVMPPSIHPDTGEPYRWLVDPRTTALEPLPPEWRAHFADNQIPDYVEKTNAGQPDEEPWAGPTVDQIIRWALEQPGARRRPNGIKFQCPECRSEGHDKSKDNAIVYLDGRWGCAYDNNHKTGITEAIGMVLGSSTTAIEKAMVKESDVDNILKNLL